MTEADKDQDFDAAFAEVAAAAEKAPAQAEADAKAAEAAAKTQADADAKAKADADVAAKAQVEADAKAKADADAAAKANEGKTAEQLEAEKAAADAAAKARTEADVKAKADADAAAKAADAKAKTEAEEKAKADAAKLQESLKSYEPSEEEKKALEQFKKDFPNEYAAMEARFKSVDRTIDQRVYAAVEGVMKTVAPRLEEVSAGVTAAAAERHFAALHAAHADYDAVIKKVPEWIKTLPSYAQAGAQAVYDGGTTEEVLALVADFKKAVGTVVPDPAADAAKVEAEAKAKKAREDAAALAPVSGRRSATAATKGAPDPNDFDGAWAELSAAAGAATARR